MQKLNKDAIEQVLEHIRVCDGIFTRDELKKYVCGACLPLSPFELDRIVLWMKEAGAVKEQGGAYRYVRLTEQ